MIFSKFLPHVVLSLPALRPLARGTRLFRRWTAGAVLLVGASVPNGAFGAPAPTTSTATLTAPHIDPAALRPAYDVVVAGAGTGGTMAAVQAARLGCRVLLLEETDWIGGQMSAAGVTSMDEAGDRVRRRGLYREFTERVNAYYAPLGLSTDTCAITENHFAVEARVARRILLEMLAQARSPEGRGGVDLLLLSRVDRVSRDGNRVTGVELVREAEDEGGAPTRHTVASRILIDATELGSVLPLTGARYRVGKQIAAGLAEEQKSSGSAIQDFTWTSVIKAYPEGAPPELILRTPPPGYDRAHYAAALDSPLPDKSTKPWSWQRFIDYRGMPDSSRPDPTIRNPWAKVTRTHMNISANDGDMNTLDLADPARYRHKEYELKTKTLGLLYYIHNDMTVPMTTWTVALDEGYDTPYNRRQNARLVGEHPELAPFLPVLNHFPVMPYARESRRLIGLETLRGKDIDRRYGPRPTPHAVAVGDYPVDLHGSDRPQHLEADLDAPADLGAIGFSPDKMGPFPIPFEVFIPESVDGLLAAEKNISQSRLANGATRLQPSTMLTGQAAGAIAALAVRRGVEPRRLAPVEVQSVLLDAGDVLVARRDGFENFPGVEPGSALWRDVQLALLYGGLEPRDAGGWRAEWELLAGESGPRGWDADGGDGLTFRGAAGLALLHGPRPGSASQPLTDGVVEVRYRHAPSAQVGVVGRIRDLQNFYSARVHQNSLELLRWKGTTVTVLAQAPASVAPGTTLTLRLLLEGRRLDAQLLGDGNQVVASCTTTETASGSGTSGAVGLRIHGTEPVEVSRFAVLSPAAELLFSTGFPRPTALSETSMTVERISELRKFLEETEAATLLSTPPATLAEWARSFAGHLRQHPKDAATLNSRIREGKTRGAR